MDTDSSVLVVGAGPVGLVLACELARRSVPIRVIDKLPTATDESRAILIHARSLEMLERIGVVEEIVASGVKTTAMEMHAAGHTLARVTLDTVDSPYLFSVTTAQTETERILTERLAALGVSIERGVELESFREEGDPAGAVRATLRHADGRQEEASAGWIVGTDGAHSTVRAQMGTKLEGSFKGERFLLGDVEGDDDLASDTMHTYFAADDGPLLVFPMLGKRIRLIAEIASSDTTPEANDVSLERLQRIVDQRAGGIALRSSHWITIFEIHHAQVPIYRAGRAFLAGDAAHIHSPAGGQGMNTGMQDAFNLGWKLALASQGRASERLLNSYHAERHPIAARVITETTRLTNLGTLDNKLAQQLRNHALHLATGLAPVSHALAAQVAETDLCYRGSPIVGGPGHHGGPKPGDIAPHVPGTDLRQVLTSDCAGHVLVYFADQRRGARPITPATGIRTVLVGSSSDTAGFDVTIADDEGVIRRRYGLEHGGVVLVRPDGYIGYLGDLGHPHALNGYFAALEHTPAN